MFVLTYMFLHSEILAGKLQMQHYIFGEGCDSVLFQVVHASERAI